VRTAAPTILLHRRGDPVAVGYAPSVHVFRWDLDRTYLDTDIRTVRGMIRSAWERPSEKRNVPGADALLRGLLATDPASRATILSGSPTQLRARLEQKLVLDGIRFDALDLKDNLGNLRRGRLRALRGQLGYKLPRLLAHRAAEPPGTSESLFGDDAEVDAVIYALYAEIAAGRVERDSVVALLREGGAYDDQIAETLDAMARIVPEDVVRDIWIVVDRGLPLDAFRVLGDKVHVVFSWAQAALALAARGRLAPSHVEAVLRSIAGTEPWPRLRLIATVQDAVRRRIVSADDLDPLARHVPTLAEAEDDLRRALGRLGPTPAVAPPGPPDYAAFLRTSRAFDVAPIETSTR
jgi:hypothetical protein